MQGSWAYPPWTIGVLSTLAAILFCMVKPQVAAVGWRENGIFFLMWMAVVSSGTVSALFYIGRLIGLAF
jgi:hypothetical protein